MSTTDHRTTAKQHKSADARPPLPGARQYVAGSGAVTPDQRADLASGVKAGARYRRNLTAASVVESAAALEADGYDVTDGEYLTECPKCSATGIVRIGGEESDCPACDGEGKRDAREVLTDWQRDSAPGRGYGSGMRDRSRMTPANLAYLAGYAAECAERMARPRLSEQESADVAFDTLAAILRRGAAAPDSDSDRALARRWMEAPYGTTRADVRVRLIEGQMSAFPRWDALTAAEVEDAPVQRSEARESGPIHRRVLKANYVTEARRRWAGFAFLEARAAIRRRHARLSREAGTDWTSPGEAAAKAADLASVAVESALQTVDASTVHAMANLAPGGRLSAAEQDALWIELADVSRADLAAARGVKAEAIKKGAQRGRKALAERITDASAARAWVRAAIAADTDAADLAERAEQDRKRTREQRDLAAPCGDRAPLPWPIREAPCNGGETGHVPAPITGAGQRASVVYAQARNT